MKRRVEETSALSPDLVSPRIEVSYVRTLISNKSVTIKLGPSAEKEHTKGSGRDSTHREVLGSWPTLATENSRETTTVKQPRNREQV